MKVKYRNGREARILIENRPKTKFCILSIDMETGVVYHHIEDGSNNLDRAKSNWDLINYGKIQGRI